MYYAYSFQSSVSASLPSLYTYFLSRKPLRGNSQALRTFHHCYYCSCVFLIDLGSLCTFISIRTFIFYRKHLCVLLVPNSLPFTPVYIFTLIYRGKSAIHPEQTFILFEDNFKVYFLFKVYFYTKSVHYYGPRLTLTAHPDTLTGPE